MCSIERFYLFDFSMLMNLFLLFLIDLISKADWSEQYILNIMDIKSTKDCDTGIGVVVKYPACILDNDRVRLYGKRLADVHSIAKPTRSADQTLI